MKIIKIGAKRCPGCPIMKPIWAEIEKKDPELNTQFFDFDDNAKDIEKYNIDGGRLPTFIFLKDDWTELERLHGEYSKQELFDVINKYKAMNV